MTLSQSCLRLAAIALCCASLHGCTSVRSLFSPSPKKVLVRSIEYHDPEAVWGSRRLALEVLESRPDSSERTARFTFDPAGTLFELDRRDGGQLLEGRIAPGRCFWNMAAGNFSSEEANSLSCETLERTRDSYVYNWGLPMTLLDPGTRLGPVRRVRVTGERRLRLRVTTDPAVGSDVWDFDFRPRTKALVGYRFFHDEAAEDGERIELEGELEAAGLRLPQTRSRYTIAADEYLGRDRLVNIQ